MLGPAIFILLFLFDDTISDGSCGDWISYKDEKCLRYFSAAGSLNYADAETYCNGQDGSHLLIIDLEEEQKNIESFLTSNKITKNVWIGLKYLDNTYQWSDGTGFLYDNWGSGSPKNDTKYCVQIEKDGKWSEATCTTRNAVICEKIQVWDLLQVQTTLMKLRDNPTVPLGFIYVQLPNEQSPAETWPWFEWEDVSQNYEGLFFRTVGGEAAPFGEVQEENSPRLESMRIITTDDDGPEVDLKANGDYSQALSIDGDGAKHTGWELQAKLSTGEVRPRNVAIKIWKRTK